MRLHGVVFLRLGQHRTQHGAKAVRAREILPIDGDGGAIAANQTPGELIAEIAGNRCSGDSGDGGTQTTLGTFGLPGMLLQVQGSLSSVAPFAPTSLFVVWGGPDDFITGGSVAVGVADILTIVGALQSVGATHILVPGMPDMGLPPAYHGNASATAFSFAFDQA